MAMASAWLAAAKASTAASAYHQCERKISESGESMKAGAPYGGDWRCVASSSVSWHGAGSSIENNIVSNGMAYKQ